MKKNICHITTVHPRFDVRIFHKECKSLSKNYNVTLIVADGLGDEIKEKINIIDIGLRQSSRLKRAKIDSKKAYKKAIELDCEVYHFHDPELMTIGRKLIKQNKKVIYDVHEDIPRQILAKPYINKYLRPILSLIIEIKENHNAKHFSAITTSTPFIRDRFLKINNNSIDINNFPIINDFPIISFNKKKNQLCYVGGLSENRGTLSLIKSLSNIDSKLVLAGNFENNELLEKCKTLNEWSKVKFVGYVNRAEISSILSESRIGMVNLKPLVNYIDALPVKMFEYMASGIPVIASNFPLWANIIKTNNCGICVDPNNEKDISNAINFILEKPYEAEQMGINGQKAVKEKYNWVIEEEKLLKVYKEVLND